MADQSIDGKLTVSKVVGIGTDAPDKLPLCVKSADTLWGAGVSLDNTAAQGGKRFGVTSNRSRFSFVDLDATAERLVIDKDGRVGIGTFRPDKMSLCVTSSDSVWGAGMSLDNTSAQAGKRFAITSNRGRFSVVDLDTTEDRLVVDKVGRVGIGTLAPTERLEVAGNIRISGDLLLANADCAEDFDVVDAVEAEPGTVMIIEEGGALSRSNRAYDKRVAGVISGAGDLAPAIRLDSRNTGRGRSPLALTGKVNCKVDASYGRIEVGDLLTTSPTPGHAMKAQDPTRAFGAVIGKALRGMEAGTGLIPVLAALQ